MVFAFHKKRKSRFAIEILILTVENNFANRFARALQCGEIPITNFASRKKTF